MRSLIIPERISMQREIVKGMGKTEMRQFAVAIVPAVFVALALWTAMDSAGGKLITLCCLFGWIGCCYAATVRIDGVTSLYGYCRRVLLFQRSQRKFYYREKEEQPCTKKTGGSKPPKS